MFEEKKMMSPSPQKQTPANREKRCIINVDQKKMSDRQKAALVNFMKKNVDLVSSKPTTCPIKPEAQNAWKAIANELNGIPGATKSWRQWRRSWQYVHRFTRQNIPELQIRAKVGTLSDTQVDLLNLIESTKTNNLSLDASENEITENLSDEDMFLEEEWLEDIDVNDKESELGKNDKPNCCDEECEVVLVPIEPVEISMREEDEPVPEIPSTSFVSGSNLPETTSNSEPSTSRKGNHCEVICLDPSTSEGPRISSDQRLQDRKHELSCRQDELNSRERELSSRERELAFCESELERRGSNILDRELELINRERELIFREREVIRRERELISREDELLRINRGILDFEKKLTLRAKELQKLSNSIRNRMEKKTKFDSGFFDHSDDEDS